MRLSTMDGTGKVTRGFVFALLLLGSLPRLAYYFTGRALWFDEAALCINILERSGAALLEPLAFKQVAPPLYLWTLKFCTWIGGNTVYAVRLPSILAGLLTLVLFWLVARRLLSNRGALLALLIAAFSQHLINYAGEAKPYAGDVAAVLTVLYLHLRWNDRPGTRVRGLRYGLTYGVLVWYSFPVVFFIAGVGLVQLVKVWHEDGWRRLDGLMICYGVSAASFLIMFLVAILPSRGNPETMAYMNHYWRHGFMPFPPTSHWDFRWYRERVFLFLDMPGGFTLPGLALFFWLFGQAALFQRRVSTGLWFVVPLALTLLASWLKLYPFHGRMTLFLAPVLFLAMAAGLARLTQLKPIWLGRAGLVVALILLLSQPAVRATRMTVSPSRHHELEKVLAHADTHWQAGDRLYLRQGDYISYKFLESRYAFPADAVLVEKRKGGLEGDEAVFREEIRPNFDAWGRVWFPMAYDFQEAVADYIAFLESHGETFEREVARGAVVYGIDFSKPGTEQVMVP